MFQALYTHYNDFRVDKITTNRFQPEQFHQILSGFKRISHRKEGISIEGRPIFSITLGQGPIQVFLWSQMHGNESTATRALLDILRFNEDPRQFKNEWEAILNALTITIVPIVNPDGAARFIRRNALDIDLNRDARALVSPEAQLLQRLLVSIKPQFAFNLHDQRRFYNIQDTANPSSISFLAPAFNSTEDINPVRERAMQLTASLRQELEQVIPGRVGIYNDSHAPRAFGDYAQSLGISTILVESGWQGYDMEKEEIRKLNFCLILAGLKSIADNDYLQYTIKDYHSIPFNDEKMLDVLIRGASVALDGEHYSIDIGIERTEVSLTPSNEYYSCGAIKDIGDLKEWHGFEEVNGEDLLVVPGRVLELSFKAWRKLSTVAQAEYLKQGYLFLVDKKVREYEHLDGLINIVSDETRVPDQLITEGPANFLLLNKQGEIRYVVFNGFLCPQLEDIPDNVHGLIIR